MSAEHTKAINRQVTLEEIGEFLEEALILADDDSEDARDSLRGVICSMHNRFFLNAWKPIPPKRKSQLKLVR